MENHSDELLTEDELLAREMAAHVGFAGGKVHGKGAPDVNPALHVQMHVAVENQLQTGDLPFVGQTLTDLLERGVSRHDAIHLLATALMDTMNEVLRTLQPFSDTKYERTIRQVVRESFDDYARHPVPDAGEQRGDKK